MVVKLTLSVTHHADTGWTSLSCDSYIIDFTTEAHPHLNEWRKAVECMPSSDVAAAIRGLVQEGVHAYNRNYMRVTNF